jgi:delta 1-pyrroline-5-carboxylate dehydrogenase
VRFEGDADALHAVNQAVAARPGPLVPVQGVTRDDLADGRAGYALDGCCWSGRSATTPRRPAAVPA